MEWTRPAIRRHFDFQGVDEKGRKRYIITFEFTNKHPEQKIAVVHVPFRQDDWSMEVPSELRREATIKGSSEIEDRATRWQCQSHISTLEGEQKGLVFLYGQWASDEVWGSCIESGKTAMITFEALVTSDKALVDQTLTLRYFPDLGWEDHPQIPAHRVPVLKPSPYYSNSAEIEE